MDGLLLSRRPEQVDYWRTRVKFGADKMVDLSISWKAWRGQQPGGFQIGHSSSLLSLILTHQYSNTPPILLLVAAAPDALVACTNVATNPTSSPFTPNCRLSGLTRKLLRLSSVLLATVALAIVADCAGEETRFDDQNISLPTRASASWVL